MTFRLGAEEAEERMTGELIPLDLMPASRTGSASRGASRWADRRHLAFNPRSAQRPTSCRRPSPSGNPMRPQTAFKDALTMLTVAEIVESTGAPAGAVTSCR